LTSTGLCVALAALGARTLVACGSETSAGRGSPFFDAGITPGNGGGGQARDSGSVIDVALPPEVEETRSFELPQAGARYVYVANPRRDSVAVIDSRTLAIQTVEAGDAPTYLVTVPGRDEAIVVNVSSNTATILRTAEGRTRTAQVPLVPGANAVAVAPGGRRAIAFLDTSRPNGGIPAGSFQDISVLFLDEGMERSLQLSVGFRPLSVSFSQDGARAFVITEDGVSILDLGALTMPTIVPNVSLDDVLVPDADGGVDAGVRGAGAMVARDVSITPDGRYALARVEGSSVLRLVDLNDRSARLLDVGAAVTDLDVAPDGTFALAVLRDRAEVVRIPLPQGFSSPETLRTTRLTGELVGSVTIAPDGSRALGYTTATASERAVEIPLAGDGAPVVLRLRKAVRAVAFSPDSRSALLVHRPAAGSPMEPGIDLETQIDRAYGYSLYDVNARFIKLQLTAADPGPSAITPDGAYAFVLLRDDRNVTAPVAVAQRISLRSFVVNDIALGSPPQSVGAVPDTQRVFVGQEHPEGRITFIDWNTGALQSVTGFELNARVVQ
jgi:DNA-binding beta-propeller fold protein YncE